MYPWPPGTRCGAAPRALVKPLDRYAPLVRQQAHLRSLGQAIAHPGRFGGAGKPIEKALVDFFLHQKAGRRNADLAGIAEFGGRQYLDRLVYVGVVEDNRRCMPAELHGRGLHVLPGERGKVLAHHSEPVNDILRITGCGIRYSEISAGTP